MELQTMMGGFEMLIVLFTAALVFILPIIALISILKNEFNGNNKLVWVLVVIFLPIIGSVLYFALGKKQMVK